MCLNQILHQFQSCLVGNQGEVGMQLQDGAGGLGLDGAEEAVLHSLSLACAVADQQDPLCLHDGADAHGVGMGGNILTLLKETLVGVDGGVGQLHMVGAVDELVAGLVEADVAVGAQAQQLQVSTTKGLDDSIVTGALSSSVGVGAVGNIAVGLVDVHMIEQVGAHEVGIALVVILGQTHVLVQVDGSDLGEVQLAGLILGDQLLVGTNRAGTGSQTQNAVGLQMDLGGDDIGSLAADIGVILGNDQSRFSLSLI